MAVIIRIDYLVTHQAFSVLRTPSVPLLEVSTLTLSRLQRGKVEEDKRMSASIPSLSTGR